MPNRVFAACEPHWGRVVGEAAAALEHGTPRLVRQRASHLLRFGKRLRPALVLLAGDWGKNRAELERAALIPELLHVGSLFQDDIMDGAGTRRGGPALHRIVGARGASLAALHLYCDAFARVTDLEVDARQRAVVAARDLCRGQLDELQSLGDSQLSAERYRAIVAGKTGALFEVAAWLGAFVSGTSAAQVSRLERFGRQYGLLFQLVDDLADLSGGPQGSGKPPLQDLRRGVVTLPVIHWLEDQRGNGATRRALDARGADPVRLEALAEQIRSSAAFGRTMRELKSLADGLVRLVLELPASPARQPLIDLVRDTEALAASGPQTPLPSTTIESPVRTEREVCGATLVDAPLDLHGPTEPASWDRLSRELAVRLPGFANRESRRRELQRGRLVPELQGLLDRARRRFRTGEGLAASAVLLAPGEERVIADRVRIAAAIELLIAAGHYQRALPEDPIASGSEAAASILGGDLLLCEFMGLLADLPREAASILARAARRYVGEWLAETVEGTSGRSWRERRLTLESVLAGAALSGAASRSDDAFYQTWLERVCETAARSDAGLGRRSLDTVRQWHRLLLEDLEHLGRWLDPQPAVPASASRSSSAAS